MAVKSKTEEPAVDRTDVTDALTDSSPAKAESSPVKAESTKEETAQVDSNREGGQGRVHSRKEARQDPYSKFEDQQAFRERVLDSASEKISDESQRVYGPPEANFERIAQLWSVLFGHPVTVTDVALALDLVNTARLIHTPTHLDSWIDKVGYSALGGELAE